MYYSLFILKYRKYITIKYLISLMNISETLEDIALR